MPTQLSSKKPAPSPWFRYYCRLASTAGALFGLLVATSWCAHWRPVWQMLPNTSSMPFNPALCFILSGVALFLLTYPSQKAAAWLAGASATFALLTLLEYLTGRDFKIDGIFLRPYFQATTAFPGRMEPLTAVCFILLNASILLAGLKRPWPHRLTLAGIFACITGVIAIMALLGFAFGIGSAYSWGAYSSIGMNTAGAFLLLGSGQLVWSWQTSRQENFNFLRWLPVTGSVTLMTMVRDVAFL